MSDQSTDKSGDWFDKKKKEDAVLKVLQYLAAHHDEGMNCVGNDDKAVQLFQERGGITVPPKARVIFFATGEQALNHGASVSLEVPAGPAPDEQLLENVLGNYPYWPGIVKKSDRRTGSTAPSNSGTKSDRPGGE
jgi:hypothetical protein